MECSKFIEVFKDEVNYTCVGLGNSGRLISYTTNPRSDYMQGKFLIGSEHAGSHNRSVFLVAVSDSLIPVTL